MRALTGSRRSGDTYVDTAIDVVRRAPASDRRARLRAGRLPSPSRRIPMLTAVEGFAIAEAAATLGVGPTQARALLGAATVHLNRQLSADVLIIEDERHDRHGP